MVEGGRTPVLSRAELEALGYRMAIFPGSGFLAAGHALEHVYGVLKEQGSTAGIGDALYPFEEFNKLVGFERVWAFDRAHADEEA